MTSEQTKRFKYWQMRTIIATMVGYALFYFVRKNFSLAMPGLEADLGISKTSLGIFLTLNGLIYGFSRFANGILADRMNARWYMAIGLALCALANFAFGFGEDVSYWITGPAVQPGKRLAENADRAVRRLKKSRRHVENRGFSASRGTHDAHKFTGSDGEIDIPDRGVVRLLLSVAGNKGAGEIRDFYRGRIGFRCIHFL